VYSNWLEVLIKTTTTTSLSKQAVFSSEGGSLALSTKANEYQSAYAEGVNRKKKNAHCLVSLLARKQDLVLTGLKKLCQCFSPTWLEQGKAGLREHHMKKA